MENGPRHTLQIGSDCLGVKGESYGEKWRWGAVMSPNRLLKINRLTCFQKLVVGTVVLQKPHRQPCPPRTWAKEEKEVGALLSTGMSLACR